MAAAKSNVSTRRQRASSVRGAASDALLATLRPLSTLALDAGLSIEDVYKILRLAAVSELVDRKSKETISPSISGISAVTGIPRAEVSKLIRRPKSARKSPQVNDQTTNSILVAWREDPRFTTANGQPARLPMYGRGSSFERLARLYGRGIPTRALLDELRRTKSVSISPDQVVNQTSGVAVDRGVSAPGIRAVGERVSELVASMLYNMKNPDSARIVSRVSSKKLSAEALPLLRREMAKLAEQYLGDIQDLLGRASRFQVGTRKGAVISVTTYCFESGGAERLGLRGKRKNYRRSS